MEEKAGDFIKWFSELNKDSVSIAGGKGSNLAEIYNLKIQVPPGFVVTTTVYDHLIESSNSKQKMSQLLEGINYDDVKNIDDTTKQIRELIINSEIPKEIEEEIRNLSKENLLTENCNAESVNVCFSSSSNCDIIVNYNSEYVEKNNERMYFYTDALMYAAIFSEKEIYECQLKRIMQRAQELSLLYKDKADFISREQCNSNLNSDLLELGNLEGSLSGSENLNNYMINLAENMQKKNNLAECKLW